MCTIEDETENSLDSHEVAYSENSDLDSSSNATCSTQSFDDSVSDIEILRGDPDDEKNSTKIGTIAAEIEAKTVILQTKRHELCGQLLAYKLMEFEIDTPLRTPTKTPNFPLFKPWESKSKSPLPVAEEIDFKVPPPPPPPISPLEYEQSYGFSCEDMLARAIQASLDDVAAKVILDSNVTPPRAKSSFAKLPGESSTGSPRRSVITASPHSPGKICPKQSTPTRFNVNNPQMVQTPAVNFMDFWNEAYVKDVVKEAEKKPEASQEDSENVVMEDFMEGDRYKGDKGKRPMSGRYAYKKRSKPSNPEAEEPGPSGSGDVPKKDSTAE